MAPNLDWDNMELSCNFLFYSASAKLLFPLSTQGNYNPQIGRDGWTAGRRPGTGPNEVAAFVQYLVIVSRKVILNLPKLV